MNNFKSILKGISVILIYFLANIILQIPVSNITDSPLFLKIIYSLASEITILFLIVLVLKDDIRKSWADLSKNHKVYFDKYFKYWFLLIGVMMLSNYVINLFFTQAVASNQQAINDMFDKAPIYTFFSAVFIAPITEELVFRLGIRKIIKNNLLFIFISGFVFGGLHVFITMKSNVELLYLIPYCTPGFIFAYLLTKTDNVFVPASIHFFHNGILLSIQFLALLLG